MAGSAGQPRRNECSTTAKSLLKFIKDEGVEMVDVRFCDLPGVMQHFTVPVSSFDQSVFDDGLGFDGSSIRGFQAINESDMQALPGPDDGVPRPVPQGQDAQRQLLHPRPDHRRGLLARPAQHRQEGAGLPRLHRHRRHRFLRP
ncbi:glutamine synthetase [Nocardioides convexus]|uniref:glutamine synthetase n=1 Tax=Nocardioides convexus TaxID=2712224 RepID=UPI0024181501|nr:glutamine synthetase [Nocardioides convexus]